MLLLFGRAGPAVSCPTPGGTIPPHNGEGALRLCFTVPLTEVQGGSATRPV